MIPYIMFQTFAKNSVPLVQSLSGNFTSAVKDLGGSKNSGNLLLYKADVPLMSVGMSRLFLSFNFAWGNLAIQENSMQIKQD